MEPKVLQPGDVGYHQYPRPPGSEMESLGGIYERLHVEHSLPDGAVCPKCQQMVADHPLYVEWLKGHSGDRMRFCRCGILAAERLIMATFPPDGPRTFENFNHREGTEAMRDAAWAFMEDGLNHVPPRRLVIQGSFGCGKSHMIEALGRVWLSWGERVIYEEVAVLMDKLRDTYSRGNEDSVASVLNHYYAHSLLLLDDLGLGILRVCF